MNEEIYEYTSPDSNYCFYLKYLKKKIKCDRIKIIKIKNKTSFDYKFIFYRVNKRVKSYVVYYDILTNKPSIDIDNYNIILKFNININEIINIEIPKIHKINLSLINDIFKQIVVSYNRYQLIDISDDIDITDSCFDIV